MRRDRCSFCTRVHTNSFLTPEISDLNFSRHYSVAFFTTGSLVQNCVRIRGTSDWRICIFFLSKLCSNAVLASSVYSFYCKTFKVPLCPSDLPIHVKCSKIAEGMHSICSSAQAEISDSSATIAVDPLPLCIRSE